MLAALNGGSKRRRLSLGHCVVPGLRVPVVRGDLAIAGLIALCGLLLALPFAVSSQSKWPDPDSFFYEVQTLEVRGESHARAVHEVFTSKYAKDPPTGERRVARITEPEWVAYSARFFRRRWTVPVIAAALSPVFGWSSLRIASLLGWALLAPLLYLLLRRRFAVGPSLSATVLSMVLPPLLVWAPEPLVDSWNLTILVAALLLALKTRDDLRWLPAWIVVVLIGSFTKDQVLVLVAATGWLALRERSRRMALVMTTGALASLPAPLLFSASLRQNLAYVLGEFQIPGNTSWGWILPKYPKAIFAVLKEDLTYPLHERAPYSTISAVLAPAMILGLILLFKRSRDPLVTLMQGSAVGALATVLVAVNYTGLRLELVFVPAVACGLALLGEDIAQRVGRRRLQVLRPVGNSAGP
jgi:hypothetical protein